MWRSKQETMATQEQRLTTLEDLIQNHVEETRIRFDKLETRFDKLETNVDGLSAMVATLQGNMNEVLCLLRKRSTNGC